MSNSALLPSIDSAGEPLIRPPRVIYRGVDWSKVRPSNGDAARERTVAALLQPSTKGDSDA